MFCFTTPDPDDHNPGALTPRQLMECAAEEQLALSQLSIQFGSTSLIAFGQPNVLLVSPQPAPETTYRCLDPKCGALFTYPDGTITHCNCGWYSNEYHGEVCPDCGCDALTTGDYCCSACRKSEGEVVELLVCPICDEEYLPDEFAEHCRDSQYDHVYSEAQRDEAMRLRSHTSASLAALGDEEVIRKGLELLSLREAELSGRLHAVQELVEARKEQLKKLQPPKPKRGRRKAS